MFDMTLSQELANYFVLHGFKWIGEDGQPYVPTAQDFDKALELIKETVWNVRKTAGEEEYATLEMGRLFVSDASGKMDVYVWMGALDDEDS